MYFVEFRNNFTRCLQVFHQKHARGRQYIYIYFLFPFRSTVIGDPWNFISLWRPKKTDIGDFGQKSQEHFCKISWLNSKKITCEKLRSTLFGSNKFPCATGRNTYTVTSLETMLPHRRRFSVTHAQNEHNVYVSVTIYLDQPITVALCGKILHLPCKARSTFFVTPLKNLKSASKETRVTHLTMIWISTFEN